MGFYSTYFHSKTQTERVGATLFIDGIVVQQCSLPPTHFHGKEYSLSHRNWVFPCDFPFGTDLNWGREEAMLKTKIDMGPNILIMEAISLR